MELRPRVVSVGMSVEAGTPIDFGWKHLLACGCFSTVLVLDPTSAKSVQSLQGHKYAISSVSWAPENYYHDRKNPYILRLASADVNGTIIVWDVVGSSIASEFYEPGCSVLEMQWIQNQAISRDLLLALHSKGRFILWNTQTQIQLWKSSISESITSWSMDPFNLKNVIFQSSQNLVLSRNFSLTSALNTDGEQVDVFGLVVDSHSASTNASLRGSLRTKSSRWNPTEFLTSAIYGSASNATESSGDMRNAFECLQTFYHGYRKECIVLVFRRKFVLYSLRVMTPLVTVLLDRSVSSFSQVYPCQQRDVFICLHENGAISVYARQGLACPVQASPTVGRAIAVSRPEPTESVGELYVYELIAFAEGSRSLRPSGPVRLAVDRSREVSIAVTSTEGRIKFFQLRAVPLQSTDSAFRPPQDPLWTLADLLPHEPGLMKPPQLCLRMHSMYTASKTDPTVCRVCPKYLLQPPVVNHLGCQSLVAVGNAHGGLQIWDIHACVLWREYQLLPVPVLGVEWLQLPSHSPNSPLPNSVEANSGSTESFHLGLVVYGWQSVGKPTSNGSGSASSSTTATSHSTDRNGVAENRLEGHNYVLIIDLQTGFTHSIRGPGQSGLAEVPGRVGTFGLGTPVHRSRSSGGSQVPLECPIELARVSQSGRLLAFLIAGQSVELWKLSDFTLSTRIPFTPELQIVTLDWYQSNTKPRDAASPHFQAPSASLQSQGTGPYSGLPLDMSAGVPERLGRGGHPAQRESLIMCTSQGSLRLVVVYGSEIDSTVIPNAILQGLPVVSMERITAVAWFTDLLAFGTADGFIALRDLQQKKTIIRFNSGGGWGMYGGPESGTGQSTDDSTDSAVNALSAASRHTTGVRRLCFLPGPTAFTRLLVLLHDSLFIWQPRDMVLVCMARFGEQLQRCLISADWACPISGPSDPAYCLILGADGALRLAQAGDSSSEMTIVPSNSVSTTAAAAPNAEQPVTKFFGSSAIPDRVDSRDPVLVPSLLPTKTALMIRHLLQHQPWRQSDPYDTTVDLDAGTVPKVDDANTTPDALVTAVADENSSVSTEKPNFKEPCYLLVCPPLAIGFSKVQVAADAFLRGIERRPDLARAFCCPTATIAERCLWTARLFGDTYEVRFWRMVVYRLTPTDSPNRWRYALDLSWDLLADAGLFRRSMLSWVQLLEERRSSPAHTKQCIRSLLLLGEHEKAVNLLLETLPECPNYNLNMYKACLLAANASGRLPPNPGPSSAQVAEDTYMSTVKLVATNLLSNGQLDEGIELLCLIGLYVDACRYLESFDQWDHSIWLAKCMLPEADMVKVLGRWAKHLASPQVNRKDFALLLNVFVGDHDAALKLLYSMNQYQLAARYLEACLQSKALSWNKESESLYRMIFVEFSKILIKLGHHQSASYYCRLAGDWGKNLQNEIDFLLS